MSIYENIDLVAKAESYLAQAEGALQIFAGGNQSIDLLTAAQTMIQLADTFLCLNDYYEDQAEDAMPEANAY